MIDCDRDGHQNMSYKIESQSSTDQIYNFDQVMSSSICGLYSMSFKLIHLLYNKTSSLKVRFRKCAERKFKFNNFKFDKIFGNLSMKEDAWCHN